LLNSQLGVLNDEAEANKNLIALFESEDLIIINMSPLNSDSTSIIRVLLNGNTKAGFLQTNFSQPPSGIRSLNLWSVAGMEKNLLLTFPTDKEAKFHAFNFPGSSVSAEVLLVITKAADADSTAASDSLLYTGSFIYRAE
jgi:hypothetical protein